MRRGGAEGVDGVEGCAGEETTPSSRSIAFKLQSTGREAAKRLEGQRLEGGWVSGL